MLTDTHAHLYWDSFKEDFDEVIQRSLDSGVTTIINVGVDTEKSEIAAHLDSEPFDSTQGKQAGMTFYSTIGIHPHEAWKYGGNEQFSINNLQKDINKLEETYHSNPQKVVAVGECGLDFFFDNNPDFIPSSLSIEDQKNLQIKLLNAQVDLAKKLNLPLVIHVRDDRSKDPQNSECWDKAIELTKSHTGIYHCYSGLPPTTSYILQNTNFLISFAATLTYPRNDYLREAAKTIPLDRIVLETDCPFLPSQKNRGQRNDPSTVREIAELIAELKGLSFEEVANQTTQNTKSLLKLN